MMQEVLIQAVPNQTFQVQLGGQSCIFSIYQLAYGLFLDLVAEGVPICAGQTCENLNRLVRGAYLGFIGNLTFVDTQGGIAPIDPVYTGLGARFRLIYLEATDLQSGA